MGKLTGLSTGRIKEWSHPTTSGGGGRSNSGEAKRMRGNANLSKKWFGRHLPPYQGNDEASRRMERRGRRSTSSGGNNGGGASYDLASAWARRRKRVERALRRWRGGFIGCQREGKSIRERGEESSARFMAINPMNGNIGGTLPKKTTGE